MDVQRLSINITVMSLELSKRKDIRLKDYDYSQNGAYFLTICVKDRHNLLWEQNVGGGL